MNYNYLSGSDGTGNAVLAHVQTPRSIGSTVLDVDSVNKWPTNFIATVGTLSGNYLDPASVTEFRGHLSSGDIVIDGFEPGFADLGNTAGQVVVVKQTTGWANSIVANAQAEHHDDGKHSAITADSVTTNAFIPKLWDGYISSLNTWVYVSATSFKVSGVDVSAQFPVGTKIKLTQTTDKFFYVTSSTFSTDTTVNVTGGSDYSLVNAAITSPKYSYMATPQGFPRVFNYSATMKTNNVAVTVGNGVVSGKFSMDGKWVDCTINHSIGSTTSYNSAGNLSWALPINSRTVLATEDIMLVGIAHMIRQSVANYFGFPALRAGTTPSVIELFYPAGTVASMTSVTTTGPSAWAYGTPTDYFTLNFRYETA